MKNSNDGAREGAQFISDHIIRVSERSFDAMLNAPMSADKVDRMLGIARR